LYHVIREGELIAVTHPLLLLLVEEREVPVRHVYLRDFRIDIDDFTVTNIREKVAVQSSVTSLEDAES
jgi:hypothetical protein